MELLYIWIEDYKNIHHQGFNFSPKYWFEFEPEFEKDAEDNFPKDENGREMKIVNGGELFLLDKSGNKITDEKEIQKVFDLKDNSYGNFFEPSEEVKKSWNSSKSQAENEKKIKS